jgi:hypothetical protein
MQEGGKEAMTEEGKMQRAQVLLEEQRVQSKALQHATQQLRLILAQATLKETAGGIAAAMDPSAPWAYAGRCLLPPLLGVLEAAQFLLDHDQLGVPGSRVLGASVEETRRMLLDVVAVLPRHEL